MPVGLKSNGRKKEHCTKTSGWKSERAWARFISIFCIVALGVAFFSGIQASSPDMQLSGDEYYNESKLMDLKVVGTMGLTDDDIQALKELPETDTVERAYSTDVICGETDLESIHCGIPE